MEFAINGQRINIGGKDATINGVNALELVAGDNVALKQEGGVLTISVNPSISSSAGSVEINQLLEGSTIQLNENGIPERFYVVKHNYETDLNGEGRTLLARVDPCRPQAWDIPGDADSYGESTIDTWLNDNYKALLDPEIQTKIGSTKFYSAVRYDSTDVEALERSIFLLSYREYGQTDYMYTISKEGTPLDASYLKVAINNGVLVQQWTRTPVYISSSKRAIKVNTEFNSGASALYTTIYFRPCFTLPSNYKPYASGNDSSPGPNDGGIISTAIKEICAVSRQEYDNLLVKEPTILYVIKG